MRTPDSAPNPVYSLGQLLTATAVLFAAVVTLLVVLSYPLLVGGGLAAAFVAFVVTAATVGYRRRTGRAAQVCLPRTGICVTA